MVHSLRFKASVAAATMNPATENLIMAGITDDFSVFRPIH